MRARRKYRKLLKSQTDLFSCCHLQATHLTKFRSYINTTWHVQAYNTAAATLHAQSFMQSTLILILMRQLRCQPYLLHSYSAATFTCSIEFHSSKLCTIIPLLHVEPLNLFLNI